MGFTLNTCGRKNALHTQLAHFIEIQGVPGGFEPGLEHLELSHLLKPAYIFTDVFILPSLIRHLPVSRNATDSEIYSGSTEFEAKNPTRLNILIDCKVSSDCRNV